MGDAIAVRARSKKKGRCVCASSELIVLRIQSTFEHFACSVARIESYTIKCVSFETVVVGVVMEHNNVHS